MSRSGAGAYRLPKGGTVDRDAPISFELNGKRYRGYAGDTLASALLANGVRTIGRSFKFHRPRGVFACGVEETGALVQLHDGARGIPTARAPLVELTEGLRARSQAGWPSVNFDLGRVLDLFSPLWAAGFYNKTFIWPSWHTYEPVIRRLAGLGRVPPERDPDRYETGNLHCDVLIVGGGRAGLEAALEAGRAGARVVLVEQHHELGGEALWAQQAPEGMPLHESSASTASRLRTRLTAEGAAPQEWPASAASRLDAGRTAEVIPAQAWLARTMAQLRALPDVRILTRTTATGCYDHNVITLLERSPPSGSAGASARERYWIVRARRVVLATGAIEQPLIFANNDRPGIMLAGAARQYLRRYAVAFGSRPLIATNNDSAYLLAKDLREAGVRVLGIADTRREISDEVRALVRALSIELFTGCIPIDTRGPGSVRRVWLGELSQDASGITRKHAVDCDSLAVSGGFAPALQLYAQAGGKLIYDGTSGALIPATPGASSPAARRSAIDIVGMAASRVPIGPRISPVGKSSRKWVDFLHDVTVADIELALRENYTSVEHVKRYTTLGMAADQGKTSAAASLEIIARLRGVRAAELGHTTMRPPFVPVTLGAIAGRDVGERFAPQRLLPIHDWHVANGAVMHDFGEWRRPVVYLRPGETREQGMIREATAVRNAAGLFDGSPLGKIEVHGPDARDFLDRFYINDLSTLQPLRARYGLMLRESGAIFDDGTVVMLDANRFLVTTTSGNASRVAQWLEEWRQCEWPNLRVAIVPVTEQWATVSLAGPRARDILAKLESDIDLSGSAFPHLSMREGTLLGTPARIYRVSFTGELTYEINVPAKRAQTLWDALLAAGTPLGLQPLGLDALLLMRLEKGFLHVGTDTDGTTVPNDVGWGKVAASKRRDYIGKRSLRLPENLRADRLQLVGLTAEQGTSFVVGSHLRTADSTEVTDGWITSAGTSVASRAPIALAMLRAGRERIGSEVDLYDAGVLQGRARVVQPPFFDPTGARMNA
ncbi:MAG TPA: 2Fe-2S iron-sulfur cluster-binding protein [Steroidobacteraceae bacterium]|nr:2Fe-2S iron-sulfur cluster-binding protein [Steroidobacteraceae bacterium]